MNSAARLFVNLPVRIRILVAIAFVVFFGLIIYALVTMLTPEREKETLINISNLDKTAANLPKGYRREIESYLDELVRRNTIDSSLPQFSDAVIRDGSYKEEKRDSDTIVAKFLVDIDSLHYSFDVSVTAIKNSDDAVKDPDIVIKCPHYLDVKYKDKKCIVETPYAQLKRYTPHYGKVSGIKYAASFKQHTNDYVLSIEIPACKNTSLMDAAEADVRKWIKSVYLDPNDYKIESINTCRS